MQQQIIAYYVVTQFKDVLHVNQLEFVIFANQDT